MTDPSIIAQNLTFENITNISHVAGAVFGRFGGIELIVDIIGFVIGALAYLETRNPLAPALAFSVFAMIFPVVFGISVSLIFIAIAAVCWGAVIVSGGFRL